MAKKDPTKELYEVEVLKDESRVDTKHIGMTEFDKKRITVPGFGNVLSKVYRKCRSKYDEYKTVAESLKDYILYHEVNVEALHEPKSEWEHSVLEKEYLEGLRESGHYLPYLIGLTVHKMRLKHGDKTVFSKKIKSYIKDRVEKYRESVDGLEEPLSVILGLKQVPIEYAFAEV